MQKKITLSLILQLFNNQKLPKPQKYKKIATKF